MSAKQIILIITLFALVLCASLVAQTIEPQVDEYIDAQIKLGRFSGTILIAKEGEIILSKGYGLANHELEVPNETNTKFRLGSVTKQFTAMAIMMLQEQGKLNVDDTVSKFLPEYPSGDKITIHHLLTHSSGIPDILGMDGFENIMRDPVTIEELIDFIKNEPLLFAPGADYKYSNSGYILLSYIIQISSGQSYENFVVNNILKPLGMKDTGQDNAAKVLKNRADGYFPSGKGLINAPYLNMEIASGGGGLYSTVEDLYKWDRALYTNKLINDNSKQKMLTPYTNETYCYGWRKAEEFGRTCYRHGGGIEGFVTEVRRYVDDDVFVAVLSNFINAPVKDIAKDLSAILFGEEYTIPKEAEVFEVAEDVLQSYTGVYEIEPGNTLEVTLADRILYIAPPGQPPMQILPESETKFFVKVFKASMSFVADESGDVTELILHMPGNDMHAKKLKQ